MLKAVAEDISHVTEMIEFYGTEAIKEEETNPGPLYFLNLLQVLCPCIDRLRACSSWPVCLSVHPFVGLQKLLHWPYLLIGKT